MIKKNRLRVVTAILGLCLAVACSSTQAGFEFSFSSVSDVDPMAGDVVVDLILDITAPDDGPIQPYFQGQTTVAGLSGLGTFTGSLGSTATVTGMNGVLLTDVELPSAPDYSASNISILSGPVSTDGVLFQLTVDVSGAQPGEVFTLTPSGSFISDEAGTPFAATLESPGTISVAAVPEPSSILCLLGAGAACGFIRRRRA